MLSGGKVVGEGSPEEMRNSPSETVRQFMQGLPDGPVPFDFPSVPLMEDLIGAEQSRKNRVETT